MKASTLREELAKLTENEFQAILDSVVTKNRMERFRQTTDPLHSDYKEGARGSVLLIYLGELLEVDENTQLTPKMGEVDSKILAPTAFSDTVVPSTIRVPAADSRPTAQESRLLIKLAHACPYWQKTNRAGCGCAVCHSGYGHAEGGRITNDQRCMECLRETVLAHNRGHAIGDDSVEMPTGS